MPGTQLRRRIVAVVCAVLGTCAAARAQGTVEVDSFDPGANDLIRAMALQTDGKIVVGGHFTMLGGGGTGTAFRSGLGRLFADGSLDTTFSPVANGVVTALAVQSDGKILVGGRFTVLNGVPRWHLGRLNADGSLDSSFNPGADDDVLTLAIQSDGKIVVGGRFTKLGGGGNGTTPRNDIGRLNADGSLDASFDPGADNWVSSVLVQPNGEILVGGDFVRLGGGGTGVWSRRFIGRLNADGAIDASFDVGTGTVLSNRAMVLQTDGKVVVGGDGIARRLNSDGSLDRDLRVGPPPVGPLDSSVAAIALQADGKILIGGTFTKAGTSLTPRLHIARFNADGSLDASFDPGVQFPGYSATGVGPSIVWCLLVQLDQKIVVGGLFRGLGGGTGTTPRVNIGRLHDIAPPASDDLVVDFGAFGVWLLLDGDRSAWHQLHSATAKNIATGDLDGNGLDEVIVDFGSQFGLWVWANNASWYQLHPSSATRMVTGDLDGNGKAEVLIDFPGLGIWVWANNTSWNQLHPANSNNMVTADLDGNGKKEAIIDFPGSGIWVWQNNTSWFQLHSFNSRLMTAGDFDGNGKADLIVDVAGYGLWEYANNSSWSQVHPFSASHLATGDVDGNGRSDLVVDFGNPYGIWLLLNSTTWSKLHPSTSTNILTADIDGNGKAEVIVNFAAAGLWVYANNSYWVQLHSVSPGVIALGHINAPAARG